MTVRSLLAVVVASVAVPPSSAPSPPSAGVGNGAIAAVTVTNLNDEIIVANRTKVSSSFPQEAGIQTHGQQAWGEVGSGTADAAGDSVTIARRRRRR